MTDHGRRSTMRALTGTVSLVAALVVIPMGFVSLIAGLQNVGYGSREMWLALGLLGAGGGLAALGIALLIWEMSVRYGIRR